MFGGPLTNESAEKSAKLMFYGGFLLLPWLWFANAALFWDKRQRNPVLETYVRRSVVAFAFSCAAALVWFVVIYTVGKDWSIWVIFPYREGIQRGEFSSAVFG
eukprot:TRINITY_DN54666_c0_g1_i1.p1 TRINITY_DN54666_c0_g1~~TRINITY_DN54666_c0_g1_i1.p1  ORF type:complete len:103 (+),score=11.74 TRINITY_DN54666_c0_g1_i1:27-335(+)